MALGSGVSGLAQAAAEQKAKPNLLPNASAMGWDLIKSLSAFGQRLAEQAPQLAEYAQSDATRQQLSEVLCLFADRLLDRGSQERSEFDQIFRQKFKQAGVSLMQQEKVLRNPWFWVFQALSLRARARAIGCELEEIDFWFRTGQATPFSEVDGIIGEIFEYFQQSEPGMELCAKLLEAGKPG